MSLIRSIKAVISAEVSGFTGPVKQAERSADDLGTAVEGIGKKTSSSLGGLGKNLRDNRDSWDRVGSSAIKAGTAIGVGLGLASRAAISWESAFAGVQKTVNDTEEGYAALSDELRALTRELPASHEEIAGVAEAAGQLGVQRENIVDFTKVMIDLGESTNLSANDAATGLARFSNVMGTSLDDVDRLGSTIVGLGNNFATTESEIMSMASRLSGAGRQAELTEGDVLGIATALSSVGIEAEAGGTAFSRVLIEMGKSVDTGNDKLLGFARTAGMSGEEFQKLWGEDSGEAVRRFVQGLGELQESGESLEPVLSELGFTDIRVGDALRRTASSSDLFTAAMERGNLEFEKNNALQEEAEKRYATTESKLRIAQNTMRDAAIDAGAVLGPALAGVAGFAADVADAFVNLPTPVQEGAVAIAGVASAGLLLLGTGAKVLTWATDMSDALGKIGATGSKASRGISLVQSTAKKATVALVGLAIAGALVDFEGKAPDVDELTNAFLRGGDAASIFNKELNRTSEVQGFDYDVRSLGDALRYSFDPGVLKQAENLFGKVGNAFGLGDSSTITHASKQLETLDSSLASLVASGNQDEAERIFASLAREAEATGYSVEELESVLPGYTGALAAAENQEILTANAASELEGELEGMAGGLDESAAAAEEAEQRFADLLSTITLLGGGLRAEQEAALRLREAIAAAGEVAKDDESTWDDRYAVLREISEATVTLAGQQLELGKSNADVTATVANGRSDFIAAAEAMGFNAEEAEALADAYQLLPELVETEVRAAGVKESTAEVLELDEMIIGLDGKIVTVEEEGAEPSQGRVLELDGAIFGLEGKTVEVKEIGATPSGARVVELDGVIYRLTGKEVDVEANVSGEGSVWNLIYAIDRLSGKRVTVGARVEGGTILANADGGLWDKSQQLGLVRAFRNGGTIGQAYPQIRGRQSSTGVLWSEAGSGPWEAFISGHPAKRGWSRAIAAQTVARLGGRVEWTEAYANGGIRTSGSGFDYGRLSEAMGPFRTSEIREATKIYVDKVMTNDSGSFVRDAEGSFGRLNRP